MIKKYIGISLISASLAFAGCSSNDDGDDEPGGDVGGNGGGGSPVIEVPATVTLPDGAAAPTLDILGLAQLVTAGAGETGPTFNTLGELVGNDMEVLAALNSGDILTVFAPTDAAFEAIQEVTAAASPEDVNNILKYHVVSGALDSTLIGANIGGSTAALNEDSLSFTMDGDAVLVNDANIIIADQYATNGIVHVIDKVLIPPVATDPEPMPGGDGGAGGGDPSVDNLGPSLNALRDNGNTDYVSLHQTAELGGAFDENTWTAFVPTNEAIAAVDAMLAANADQAGAFAVLNNHIMTNGAFTSDDLLGQGTATANGGAALTFGGAPAALTVNGFNATPFVVDGIAATIYIIDGVIQ